MGRNFPQKTTKGMTDVRRSGPAQPLQLHAAFETLKTPKEKRQFYYDRNIPGLCILVQPKSGHRAFGWYRKVRSKPRFLSIGPFPETSVQEARDVAERWNGKLKEWKAARFEGSRVSFR
jgi:hypothetical protein